MENISIDEDGKSAYFRRHNFNYNHKTFVYGSGVWFKPAPHRDDKDKGGPDMKYGIFLGYRLKPGGHFAGEYVVADIDQFAGRPIEHFAHDCPGTDWMIHPHITMVVRMPKKGVFFPCKEKYDFANCTLEGRDIVSEARQTRYLDFQDREQRRTIFSRKTPQIRIPKSVQGDRNTSDDEAKSKDKPEVKQLSVDTEVTEDLWEWTENTVSILHMQPRRLKFDPVDPNPVRPGAPSPDEIEDIRITEIHYKDGTKETIEDTWNKFWSGKDTEEDIGRRWIGRTIFRLKPGTKKPDPPPDRGKPPVSQEAVLDPPDVVPPADPPPQEGEEPERYEWRLDSRGRRYKYDMFGNRVQNTKTKRPHGVGGWQWPKDERQRAELREAFGGLTNKDVYDAAATIGARNHANHN